MGVFYIRTPPRSPGLWIFTSKSNNRTNTGYFSIGHMIYDAHKLFRFVVGKQYHITIQQLKVSGNYYYEIIVNGVSQCKILNKKAKRFYNVEIYESGRYNPAFTSKFGWISAIKTQQF